jgi:hypothetical protein
MLGIDDAAVPAVQHLAVVLLQRQQELLAESAGARSLLNELVANAHILLVRRRGAQVLE